MAFENLIRPSQIGLVITSDDVSYNGASLVIVVQPGGATVSTLIKNIDTAIVNTNAVIAALTFATDKLTMADTITTGWATLAAGDDLQVTLVSITDQISLLTTTLDNLDTTEVSTIGVPHTASAGGSTLLTYLTVLDAATHTLQTGLAVLQADPITATAAAAAIAAAVATKQNLIADHTLTSTKLTLTGVAAATYKQSNITVDTSGRVTAATSDFNLAAIGLANNQTIRYNSGTGKWENIAVVGYILPAGASSGNALTWSGSAWVASALSTTSLSNFNLTGVADGDLLRYNVSSGKWENIHYNDSALVISIKPTLSSAEALAAFTVPKAAIAAPGANKYIDIISVTAKQTYLGVAYAGNAITLRYTGGADVAAFTAGFTTSAATLTQKATVAAGLAMLANTGVEIYIPSANPTLGTGTFQFDILYRIVTLT